MILFLGPEFDKELEKQTQLIKELQRQQNRKRFNIIGFETYASSDWRSTRHCAYHPGTRLIPIEENGVFVPDILQCPSCGSRFGKDEAPTDENISGKFSGQNKTRIITPKTKKKKFYDKSGNLINDPDLIKEIQRGANVIWYHEEKKGEENHTVKK